MIRAWGFLVEGALARIRAGELAAEGPTVLPLALLGLADALVHEGQLKQAIAHLEEAARFLRELGEPWVDMAQKATEDAARLREDTKDPDRIVIEFGE